MNGMARDWAAEITKARRRGVDLTAEMNEADWAEYRGQCRSWLESEPGQKLRRRALDRIASKHVPVDEAS